MMQPQQRQKLKKKKRKNKQKLQKDHIIQKNKKNMNLKRENIKL